MFVTVRSNRDWSDKLLPDERSLRTVYAMLCDLHNGLNIYESARVTQTGFSLAGHVSQEARRIAGFFIQAGQMMFVAKS